MAYESKYLSIFNRKCFNNSKILIPFNLKNQGYLKKKRNGIKYSEINSKKKKTNTSK